MFTMRQRVQKNYHAQKKKGGYILLLTLLIISILLAISLGIFAISLKETTLSSFLRDSEKALAAADRGDWLAAARYLYDGDDGKAGGGYYSGTKPRSGAILDEFNALRKQLEAQGISVSTIGAAAGLDLVFWGALAWFAARKLRHGRR